MDFGDPPSIERFAQMLRERASETTRTIEHTHSRMELLPGQADAYQRKAAYGFLQSWGRAHDALTRVTTATTTIASSLEVLASQLSEAEQQWAASCQEASVSGFTVHPAGSGTTVSAAANADASTQQHAQAIAQALRNAASNAANARATADGQVASSDTSGVRELGYERAAVTAPWTGDGGLSGLVQQRCAQLIGVHDQVETHRTGR